jgi:hypothetical protein
MTDQPSTQEREHIYRFGEHGTCVCGETPPFGSTQERCPTCGYKGGPALDPWHGWHGSQDVEGGGGRQPDSTETGHKADEVASLQVGDHKRDGEAAAPPSTTQEGHQHDDRCR